MCIIQISGPETPDPTQLDLFGRDIQEAETVKNSTDSAGIQPNEPLIRSPTEEQIYFENGKNLINEVRESFESSLLRKSRELVSKSYKLRQEENDLARNQETPQNYEPDNIFKYE